MSIEKNSNDEPKYTIREAKELAERYWNKQLIPLPQKAQLAFAVRCLQRTYYFINKGKDMPKEIVNHAYLLIKAIKNAEEMIGTKVSTDDFEAIENTYTFSSSAFFNQTDPNHKQYLQIGIHIGLASTEVMICAEKYCSHNKVATSKSIAKSMGSIEIVWGILFGNNIPDFFIGPVQSDLNLLKQRAQAENWTDDTQFPAEFFGPLWPEVSAEGFRAEEGIENLQLPQLNGDLIRKLQHPK